MFLIIELYGFVYDSNIALLVCALITIALAIAYNLFI